MLIYVTAFSMNETAYKTARQYQQCLSLQLRVNNVKQINSCKTVTKQCQLHNCIAVSAALFKTAAMRKKHR